MKRPHLNQIPIPKQLFAPRSLSITMSPGQWDSLLASTYDRHWLLLEVEIVKGVELIVRAFQKPEQIQPSFTE